jgi:outer membrane protein TolC
MNKFIIGFSSFSSFLSFLSVFFWVSAQAQDGLSLEEAVARSLQKNFDVQVARLQTEVAANNNTWGQTSALPTIGLTAAVNSNISDQSQNPTSFIQAKLQTQGLQYGASLNWTLFDGFGMFASKRQLELLETQSEGNAALVMENAVQAVTLAYYDVKMQQERLNVLREVIQLSRERLDYVKYKRDLGAGSTFEVLQFDNAIITDSTNFLLQSLALRNAVRNLNVLMGEEVDAEWTFSTVLEAPTVAYRYTELWNEVASSNQSLRNQVINSLLAAQDARLAKSFMYPVVSFNAGITESENQFSAGELSARGATLNYFGNFTLNFNLFNGGKTRRALQNARVREEISLLSQQELERQVQADLRNLLDLYGAQLTIYELTATNVENQRLALEIARDRFQTGLINTFDYRAQQLAFMNAGMAQIEAMQQLLNTHTQMVRLRGGLVK